MADSGIKRLIQLILDKDAAAKAQKDINDVGDNVESKWKSVAAKIAGYLGVAFLAKKVIDFGRESVKQAEDAQAAWHSLANTIDNTGASFKDLEKDIRATSEAFQDATTHDNEEFAKTLDRLITLTGDVSASLNNMGLIANVAAKFFGGELEPAANLVAKVMNGNVTQLKRLGIEAKTAQEGLDTLARRSMHAAEQEAETFAGQVKQLNNSWDDFVKKVGEAIIQSDGSSTAFDVLRNVIQKLTEWVERNADSISRWVTDGVNFAIDAADIFIRAVDGMARVLAGGFMTSLGLAAQGLAKFIEGLAAVQKTAVKLHLFFGDAEEMKAGTLLLENQAAALDEWGKSVVALGTSQVSKGIDVLSTPLFNHADFQGKPKVPKLPGEDNKPRLSANTLTDEQKKVQDAIKEYEQAGQRIAVLTQTLGENFDKTGADIDRTTKLLSVMAEQGIDDSLLPMFIKLQNQLGVLTNAVDPLDKVFMDLNKTLRDDLADAADTGATQLDKLRIRQQALQKAMQEARQKGIDPQSHAFQILRQQYKDTTDAINEQTLAMQAQAATADLLADILGAALEGGLADAAAKKARQNAIEAAEMLVRAGAFALFGNFPAAGAALGLAAQYAGVAAAWGVLAASSRGSGGSGAAVATTAAGGTTTGGQDLSQARESSAQTTRDNAPPSADVSIYLVGPGFDMLNPAVQRVVYGAQQQAKERYGDNARIRTVPRGG